MAYSKQQRRQHIAELQKYLYSISLFNYNIPPIMTDGNYGNETIQAVRAFQHEYGLPETGNTDNETWKKIVSIYKEYINSEPSAVKVFPSRTHILRNGDSGSLVYIIQSMLNDISHKYNNFPHLSISGKYNDETANAVRVFRRRMGLPKSDDMDSVTWNILAGFYEHMNRILK